MKNMIIVLLAIGAVSAAHGCGTLKNKSADNKPNPAVTPVPKPTTNDPATQPPSASSDKNPSSPSSSPSTTPTPAPLDPSLAALPIDPSLAQGAFLNAQSFMKWTGGVSGYYADTLGSALAGHFSPENLDSVNFDDCELAAFKNLSAQAHDSVAITSGTATDLASCENTASTRPAGTSLSETTHSFQIDWAVQCPGQDLSFINGKPGTQVPAGLASDAACPFARVLINYQSKYSYLNASSDAAVDRITEWSKMAIGGGPCVYQSQGDHMLLDGCQEYLVSAYHNPQYTNGFVSDMLISKIYHGVTIAPGSTTYTGGTIDFIFNDWQGTITFHGANTPATWSATRFGSGGAIGTPASGRF